MVKGPRASTGGLATSGQNGEASQYDGKSKTNGSEIHQGTSFPLRLKHYHAVSCCQAKLLEGRQTCEDFVAKRASKATASSLARKRYLGLGSAGPPPR